MCIYSNMYVYLAILLGIVLVVYIYKRYNLDYFILKEHFSNSAYTKLVKHFDEMCYKWNLIQYQHSYAAYNYTFNNTTLCPRFGDPKSYYDSYWDASGTFSLNTFDGLVFNGSRIKNYTPTKKNIEFTIQQNTANLTLEGRFTDASPTISTFDASSSTTLTIPSQALSWMTGGNQEYWLHLYRVERNSNDDWTTNVINTNLISSTTSIRDLSRTSSNNGLFTINHGNVMNMIYINLIENNLTINITPNAALNTVFPLPSGQSFFTTNTKNSAIDTAYVVRIYKLPANGTWTSSDPVNNIIFEGKFAMTTDLIQINLVRSSYYNYTATLENNLSLPAGSHTFTFMARNADNSSIVEIPDKTINVTTTQPISNFSLNLYGSSTLNINGQQIDINQLYCTRNGISKFSILIDGRINTKSSVSIDALTSTSTLTGLNFDMIFDNNYYFNVSGATNKLSYVISAPKLNGEPDIPAVGTNLANYNYATNVTNASSGFTDKTNIRGYRLVLNNTTGTANFCFLTKDASDTNTCVTDTNATIPISLIYPSSANAKNLTIDIKINGHQSAEWDPYDIPVTTLTMARGSSDAELVGGFEYVVASGNQQISLPNDTYNITVTAGPANARTTHLSATLQNGAGLSKYVLDVFNNTFKLYNSSNTQLGSTYALTNMPTSASTRLENIVVSISGKVGNFVTSGTYSAGGIHLSQDGAITDTGYIISGIVRSGQTGVTLPSDNYIVRIEKSNSTIIYNASGARTQLNNITGYTLNFTTSTLAFNTSTNTAVTLQITPPLIEQYSGSDQLNITLTSTSGKKIGFDTSITIAERKYSVNYREDVKITYHYALPNEYTMIPGKTYKLKIQTGTDAVSDRKTYGIITLTPTERINRFSINQSFGRVIIYKFNTYIALAQFDVNGLRDETEKKLYVTLIIDDTIEVLKGTQVNAEALEQTLSPTSFEPPANVLSGSDLDSPTIVQVKFKPETTTTTGSATSTTLKSQLDLGIHTIKVTRTSPGTSTVLYQKTFDTSPYNTFDMELINYNRTANTVNFLRSDGTTTSMNPNLRNLVLTSDISPSETDFQILNNEKLEITVTQTHDYGTREISGSNRVFTDGATLGSTTSIIAKQRDIQLGSLFVSQLWYKGHVIFVLSSSTKSASQIPAGTYKLNLNTGVSSNDYEFTITSPIRYIRLNLFTGVLEGAINTTTFERLKVNATTVLPPTNIRMHITALQLKAKIKLNNVDMYGEGAVLPIPTYYTDCSNKTALDKASDVFVVYGPNKTLYNYDEASTNNFVKSLPNGLTLATLDDIESAAKSGANWDIPGWILGGTDVDKNKPPVYPSNEFNTVQQYFLPNYANVPPLTTAPYDQTHPVVISYLPSDGKAGILLKGDRSKVPSGYTAEPFNRYTGRDKASDSSAQTEVFHILLNPPQTFEEARKKCHAYKGEIARESDVSKAGASPPKNAQWKKPGIMYKAWMKNDAQNLVAYGFPTPPVKGGETDGLSSLDPKTTVGADAKFDGVICIANKSLAEIKAQEIKYDASGNLQGTISDYNESRHIWSAYDQISYSPYIPKNINAIEAETNLALKASMIVNDARTQNNIVFVTYTDENDQFKKAEDHAGCFIDKNLVGNPIQNMTCIALNDKDEKIEKAYTAPISSTGKWTNVDLNTYETGKTEGFESRPIPAPGMQRMLSDVELFHRTPASTEILLAGQERSSEGYVGFPRSREGFATESATSGFELSKMVEDILNCQAVGGAVNPTGDENLYPGCNTLCCLPDDGRVIDPSLIPNRRRRTGPGAQSCDDEAGCAEADSKPVIRHTPAPPAYRLKKKSETPASPAPKCASATPLRTAIANKKSEKIQTLRGNPQ